MKRVDEINSRGHADGWSAQSLQRVARRNGVTMAAQFGKEVAGSSAFSVPAKAVRATAKYVTYEFADGSTIKFPVNL